MTNDAPERIWADLAQDRIARAVAAAYEDAAVIASYNVPATVKASAIRARTPADALAAREARDKQVRAEALREARSAVDSIDDKGESDIARALLDARRAILALIPADKEGDG